ncbi:MAG TPA: hypothetical protein VJ696_05225, partial [Rhodanobacteraceae bacterium]|nr:hypothetical protein [Rhodanobacteraceae bacterium]
LKTRESPQPEPVESRGDVPDEVFDHVRIGPLERALDVVVADLAEIARYRDASSPDSIVFAHTYDYIWPDGAPFRLGPVVVGPWAKPALDAVGLLDPEAQRIVTGWLLDRFADALHAFASANANVRIIDSRGTLTSKSQWENEIHPTAAGFARIARECWIPALSDLLE